MKKIIASLLFIFILSQISIAQSNRVRPRSLGLSFVMYDFNTAQKIRNGSIEKVLRDKDWADFKEMSPGLAVTYFKGLSSHVEFAGTLGGSYVKMPLRDKPVGDRTALLVEADASLNLKMFADEFWVNPYLIVGLGASKYKDYYGAIAPLGGGIKVNFVENTSLFITAQYRLGITKETTNYHFVYGLGFASALGSKN